MLRIVVRSARAHWRRYLATVTAVVLGVSVVVGAFVLTDSLNVGINRLLADSIAHADLIVRPTGEGQLHRAAAASGIDLGSGPGVPASLAGEIRRLPGVTAVDVSVGGPAELFGKDGRADLFDLATVSNWPNHPAMHAEQLIAGRAPRRADDVVIDTATSRARRLAVGDRLRIGTSKGIVIARVTGLAQRAGGTLGAAGSILAFTTPRTRQLTGAEGRDDDLSITLAPDAGRVRSEIAALLPPGAIVLNSKALLSDAHARVDRALRTFVSVLLGFAAVILFVTTFLIWNTFSMLARQRAPELALLRAVGATRHQITTSVISEAAGIGAIAASIGITIGLGLAGGLLRVLDHLGVNVPHGHLDLEPRTALIAAALGVGVTVLSVIGPARRVTAMTPMAALSVASEVPVRTKRVVVGLLLLAAGAVLGAVGVLNRSGSVAERQEWVAAGGAVLVLGLITSSSSAVQPVARLVESTFGRGRSVPSRLARRNAARHRDRTGANASALMVGVALVATTLVVGASLERAFGGGLRSSLTAPVVVDASGVVSFDSTLRAAIDTGRGVRASVPIGQVGGQLRLPGSQQGPTGVSLPVSVASASPHLERVLDPNWRSGRLPRDVHQVAISSRIAEAHHVGVGERIQLTVGSRTARLLVSGVYRNDEILGDVVARPGALARLDADPTVRLILVLTADRPSVVAARLATVVAAVPNAEAETTDRYIAARSSGVELVLGIVDIVLILAIAVAALSIADTLTLSVLERTSEFGLLRALGMAAPDVRRTIWWEGVTISLLGGIGGVTAGVGFGSAVAFVLPARTAQLTVPVLGLGVLVLGCGALGFVAAAWPARRAVRLDPIRAMADL